MSANVFDLMRQIEATGAELARARAERVVAFHYLRRGSGTPNLIEAARLRMACDQTEERRDECEQRLQDLLALLRGAI